MDDKRNIEIDNGTYIEYIQGDYLQTKTPSTCGTFIQKANNIIFFSIPLPVNDKRNNLQVKSKSNLGKVVSEEHEYGGQLVAIELRFCDESEVSQTKQIGIILDIAFGEVEEVFPYKNKFLKTVKSHIRFGIKHGKLYLVLKNGDIPLNQRGLRSDPQGNWQVNTTGTKTNPSWDFKATTQSAVLKGLRCDEKLGIVSLSDKKCLVEATFQIHFDHRDLKITAQEGAWGPNATPKVRVSKSSAFFKYLVKQKFFKDYANISKIVLEYEPSKKLSDIFQAIDNELTGKLSELAKISGLSLAEDYIGADLMGADLSKDDLSGANLSGANLRKADLRDTNLSGTDLRKADLRDTNLSGFIRRGVIRRGANLSGADLRDANLSHANLRKADLRDTNLSGANLRKANLRDTNLSGAILRKADLRDTNLSGFIRRGVMRRGANLSGADLRDANLSGADLRKADLSGANLSGTDLSKADLRGANLSGTDLSKADLRDTIRSGAILRKAIPRDTIRSDAIRSKADLRDTIRSDAIRSKADLRDTIRSGAIRRKAIPRDTIRSGAIRRK